MLMVRFGVRRLVHRVDERIRRHSDEDLLECPILVTIEVLIADWASIVLRKVLDRTIFAEKVAAARFADRSRERAPTQIAFLFHFLLALGDKISHSASQFEKEPYAKAHTLPPEWRA